MIHICLTLLVVFQFTDEIDVWVKVAVESSSASCIDEILNDEDLVTVGDDGVDQPPGEFCECENDQQCDQHGRFFGYNSIHMLSSKIKASG